MTPAPSPLRTWLQLLRAPNLFTVPGDPLAGFLLASGGKLDRSLLFALLASLAFYSVGLLSNDLADLDEDRRERPNRPLPSGAANTTRVRTIAGLLAVLALGFCAVAGQTALIVGSALLACILAYNFSTKRLAVIGAVNMGLCRGLSLLLGATFGLAPSGSVADAFHLLPPLVGLAVLGTTIYIAAVTNVARHETQTDPPLIPRFLPYAALLATVLFFFLTALDRHETLGTYNLGLYLVSAYTLFAGFRIHRRLTAQPAPPIPPMIGQLIRLLLPLQAAYCVASRSIAGSLAALFLFLIWPLSRAVSKRFYAS